MKYKKDFDLFQKKFIDRYPDSLGMRNLIPTSFAGKNVLDVGCGSGLDLEFIASKQPESLSAVDVSLDLVEIAKSRLPDTDIRLGDFKYLPWGRNEFDVVWSKYALQHADDISIPLQEIYRVLKNEGQVFLQVTHPMRTASMIPSKNYFQVKTQVHYPTIDGKIITEPHHSLAEWINAIIQTGFTIEKVEEIINRPIDEYKGVITPSAIIFVLKK